MMGHIRFREGSNRFFGEEADAPRASNMPDYIEHSVIIINLS